MARHSLLILGSGRSAASRRMRHEWPHGSRRAAHHEEPHRLYSTSLLVGVGKEKLLAIDLVTGDRRLAFPGNQPIDESLAGFLLHMRKFVGVHQHDAVLIEQPLVALDDNGEIAAILEGYPGAAASLSHLL